MRRVRNRGFTLIELLIVVAIIGIIVATSIVNFFNAIQRARQRRSMAEMRGFSTALEAYAGDHNLYPPPSGYSLPAGMSLPTLTCGLASSYLAPTYLKRAVLIDGWNSWFLYGTTPDNQDYIFVTTGKDGTLETSPVYGITTMFDNDIILVDGSFAQFPDGVQQ
jgi:general secretion pathway protein G